MVLNSLRMDSSILKGIESVKPARPGGGGLDVVAS